MLHFRDEKSTNRIATSINHTIELCDEGSKEPFQP